MIEIWVLTICTSGWAMCGSIDRFQYTNKEDCYEARDSITNSLAAENIKYVVCTPKVAKPTPNTGKD